MHTSRCTCCSFDLVSGSRLLNCVVAGCVLRSSGLLSVVMNALEGVAASSSGALFKVWKLHV